MSPDIVWPDKNMTRIPYAAYHDEDMFEEEREKVFKGPTWHYVGLEAEVSQVGDFITTFIGDISILVNRDADGKIHAFVNRCKHRGSPLQRETSGNVKTHNCIYHQWAWKLDGGLQGVPFAKGMKGEGGMPPDFDRTKIKLDELTVQLYKGVIFATFDVEDAEPLLEYLGPKVVYEIDRLFSKKVKVLGYQRQRVFGNWKLYNDNVRDPNHGGLLHMFHATFGLYRLSQVGGAKLDAKGRHNITYNELGSDDAEAQKDYAETKKVYQEGYKLKDMRMLEYKREYDDRVSLVILSVFPGVVFQQIANSLCTRQIRPKGLNEVELYWTYFGYEDEDESMTQHRLLQSNLAGPGGYISMEDGEACQIVHDTTVAAGSAHAMVEVGGRGPVRDSLNLISEIPVRGFWGYYASLMGAKFETPVETPAETPVNARTDEPGTAVAAAEA